MRSIYAVLLCLLLMQSALAQTPFTITYTGLTGNVNPTGVPAGLTVTTPYDGVVASCVTTANGATTSYSTVMKVNANYQVKITSVEGTAYASNAGSRNFSFQLVNGSSNYTSEVTSISSSSNCGGNAVLTPLTVPAAGQTVSGGNSFTISVLRAPGSATGGGYSFTKTLVIKGTIASVVTPVNLLLFKGYAASNGNNQLQWTTTNEINFSHFEIERSYDNDRFEKIAEVHAKGDAGGNQNHYSYVDVANSNYTAYYRLKMVDKDGTSRYSGIVAIQREAKLELSVYPNPATNQLMIKGVTGKISYAVTDVTGRRLLGGNTTVTAAGNAMIDVTALPKGVYFLSCNNEKLVRFIKE